MLQYKIFMRFFLCARCCSMCLASVYHTNIKLDALCIFIPTGKLCLANAWLRYESVKRKVQEHNDLLPSSGIEQTIDALLPIKLHRR